MNPRDRRHAQGLPQRRWRRLGNRIVQAGLLLLLSMPAWASAPEGVRFHWFEYQGHDLAFTQPLPPGHYRNPVLAGFHPDPSVVRVGHRFYLVNSSFAWFPGIPVFESSDLVHWRQVGNAIDQPSQFDYDGLGVSRGMFAPSIAFHDGTFYVVDTAVDGSGTFVVTATNPAGPWSQPTALPQADGIDPSLFFDHDGNAYLLNNGPPQGKPLYEGHRAIWMQAFDITRRRLVGPRKVLLNGGVDLSTHPIWIEGPHLFKHDGWYYLSCAEGGTGPQHSQVILRSRSPWGPFQAYAHNPILTQRDLPAERAQPIVDAGHADLVQGPDDSWWAVFLASRAYGQTHYNTGRETFLLPVHWKDGWPIILEPGQAIPQVVAAPRFMRGNATQAPLSGNFSWRDDFDRTALDHAWMTLRVPKQAWADLASSPGSLTIHPLDEGLDSPHNPSFLARRQQHLSFEARTALDVPTSPGISAGIVAFQNETHWFFLGVHRVGEHAELFLQKRDGASETTVAHAQIEPRAPLLLKMSGDGGAYSFAYDSDSHGWRWLRRDEDGTILSTDVAGGFVGTMLGPYARTETPQ